MDSKTVTGILFEGTDMIRVIEKEKK